MYLIFLDRVQASGIFAESWYALLELVSQSTTWMSRIACSPRFQKL